MEMLLSLWLPILVSGIAAFFASFLAWTVMPHHKGDYAKLPDEDDFTEAIRGWNVGQGQYMFPYCADDPEKMKDPEFQRRWEEGPSGNLNIFPKGNLMTQNMICSFLFFVAASFCIAYLASIAIPLGADFMQVFRFVGTAGILTYCGGGILHGIWFKRKLWTDLVDGVAYGLITGAVFGLLWPGS